MLEKSTFVQRLDCEHTIIGIEFSKVVDKIINWENNREPDSERVNAIYNAIEDGQYINCHISVAVTGNIIRVYDGMHRIEALKVALNNKTISDSYIVMLDCIFNPSDDLIKDCFRNINKSIPVPEIYIDNIVPGNIKLDIIGIVKKICCDYPMQIRK